MSPVKKPTNPAGRVVRKKLTDGSIKVYRYDAYKPKPAAASGSFTVGELIAAWQTSPEWRKLAAKSRETYSRDIAALVPLSALPVAKLTRQHLVMVRNGIANGRGDGAAASFITAVGSLLAYGLDADWPVTPGISARLRKGLHRGEFPAWTEADLQLALPHLPEDSAARSSSPPIQGSADPT